MPHFLSAESRYVARRKIKAAFVSFRFFLCRIFPVSKNRVAVCTFEGRGGFGCHPKYIVQTLHERNPKIQFVWLVDDLSKEFPAYIKKVPNTPWSRAYWLSTSRIWIDNYRKPYGTRKRKNQFYLNTWHGEIGFKTIGLWRGAAFSTMARLVSRNDSDMIDLVPVSSKFGETMYPKGLLYGGEFLLSGSPRCDILHGDRSGLRKSFRKKRGLPEDAKIVMFAPTYRESAKDGRRSVASELCSIDFARLLRNLAARFGGEWVLCFRLHPQLSAIGAGGSFAFPAIDASGEDDLYEILAAMDAFVTDYSSAAFEASLLRIPVFIYADDLGSYSVGRGGLLWNLDAAHTRCVENNPEMTPGIRTVLPYPVAQTNDELEKAVADFDGAVYVSRVECFERNVGLVFDGRASSRVADVIEAKMREGVK